jgi:hypothetical protein
LTLKYREAIGQAQAQAAVAKVARAMMTQIKANQAPQP